MQKKDKFRNKILKQNLETTVGLYVPIDALNPKLINQDTAINTIIIRPWKIIDNDLKTADNDLKTADNDLKATKKDYLFFNKFFSRSIYSSIITHELSHHFHQTHLNNLGLIKEVSRRDKEFLAMIVQLETIPYPEKTQILDFLQKKFASHSTINIEHIDLLTYSLNPNAFTIRAYSKYIQKPSLITELFNGQTNWPEAGP